jgi:hypothetical protein
MAFVAPGIPGALGSIVLLRSTAGGEPHRIALTVGG